MTARQRRALPRSAFLYAPKSKPRSAWRYPVPTKGQARKAGISEGQRQRIAKNAVARSAQHQTRGSRRLVEPAARARAGATRKTTRRATSHRAARGRASRSR
jgi:hypothetical protein